MGGHRRIGRPKRRWSDVIRKDMKEKQVQTEEARENVEIENLMCRPQIGKRLKKKRFTKTTYLSWVHTSQQDVLQTHLQLATDNRAL